MQEKIMSKSEFRKSKEYEEVVEKIKNYPKGFTFTLNYAEIPHKKGNALKVVTQDCIENGILESISIGLSLDGKQTDETFRRL